jgi:hypothetical protein
MFMYVQMAVLGLHTDSVTRAYTSGLTVTSANVMYALQDYVLGLCTAVLVWCSTSSNW